MQFDPQIVTQANALVNALRSGKYARVPTLKLEHWQQFVIVVYTGLNLAWCETCRPFGDGITGDFRVTAEFCQCF